jgi:hypothetical protein
MVFQLLKSSALELVVLTFIIALGAILLGAQSGLGKGLTANSYEANITNAGLAALVTYSNYFGVIVISIIFVAIIGVIMIVGGAMQGKA